MPVEDLVVDDDDVGEAVDRVAVAVDHGARAVRGPQVRLARPVHLHDVRHDHEQRERVGGLRGEQRLRGLAEARLVGEQERPVAGGGSSDQLTLVPHQLQVARRPQRGRLGELHARRGAAVLEGAEQWAQQLPGGQPPWAGGALLGAGEVGGEERVRELPGDHRLRHHAPLVGGGDGVGVHRRGLLGRGLDAGGLQHVLLEHLRRVRDDGVLGEQGEQRGVAGRGLRKDGGDAVQALQLRRPMGLASGVVRLHPGPLLADQQGDDLELRAHRALRRAALDGRLDLAHGAGEDRDDALVVELTDASPVAGRRTTPTRLAWASSCQEPLLQTARHGAGAGRKHPHPVRGRDNETSDGVTRWPLCDTTGSTDLRQIDAPDPVSPTASWNLRPPWDGLSPVAEPLSCWTNSGAGRRCYPNGTRRGATSVDRVLMKSSSNGSPGGPCSPHGHDAPPISRRQP